LTKAMAASLKQHKNEGEGQVVPDSQLASTAPGGSGAKH
jgi:hypothetical protein